MQPLSRTYTTVLCAFLLTGCAWLDSRPYVDKTGVYEIAYNILPTREELRSHCPTGLACASFDLDSRICEVFVTVEGVDLFTTHEIKHCVLGEYHD